MINRSLEVCQTIKHRKVANQQRQHGAIAVEYALWMSVLMMLFLLLFELLRVVVIQSSLTFALADVAREARLKNDLSAMQQQVSDKVGKLMFVDRAKLNVNLLAKADNAADLAASVNQTDGRFAIYEVSYPLDAFSFNGRGWANFTFRQRYLIQREG